MSEWRTTLDAKQLRSIAATQQSQALEKEFGGIPSYFTKSSDIDYEEHHTKDRYSNILPNPATQVPLSPLKDDAGETIIGSTYINANFISGYNGRSKRYIASQGPIPESFNDFWRMVWEQNSIVIVMTTNLVERGHLKCNKYWPPDRNTESLYDDIVVTILEEEDRRIYKYMKFAVERGSERREVSHFWYTTWPDHGTPGEASSVLQFLTDVRGVVQDSQAPIIVHCSAGIGRTGTFMAIDIGMRGLEDRNRIVDVRSTVNNMRKERGGSVQTFPQYFFIHKALAQYLSPGSPISLYPDNNTKTIQLQVDHPVCGFSIRGSFPVYVVSVEVNSLPYQTGLRDYDDILTINNTDVTESYHDDVAKLLIQGRDSGDPVILQVRATNRRDLQSSDA